MTRSVCFSFCSAFFHLLEVANLDFVTTLSVSRADRVVRDTQGVEGLCLSSCFKIIVIHHHFFLFVMGGEWNVCIGSSAVLFVGFMFVYSMSFSVLSCDRCVKYDLYH